MLKTKNVLHLLLVAVLVLSVVSFLAMRNSLTQKDLENEEIRRAIREKKIANNELSAMMDDENLDDFYRSIAERDLGYGTGNEKVYIDVTGQ